MSKIVMIKRMIYNEHIARSWIEHLLISCITLKLSQYRMSFSCNHYSRQRMKICRMMNISLKLICFLRWHEETRVKNNLNLFQSSISFLSLALVQISCMCHSFDVMKCENQFSKRMFHQRRSHLTLFEMHM